MNCREARSLLSCYLDGAVTGRQMQAIGNHLAGCPQCQPDYVLLKQTQRLVSELPRPKVPADLALNLRVAVSREAALARRPRFEGLRLSLAAAMQTFMLPATAGLVSAVLIFGLLIGMFTIPAPLQGASNDVPTVLYTPPELSSIAPYAMEFGSSAVNADSIVVEVYVDANGRVLDYRPVQEPVDAQQVIPELKNALIFTVFRPATTFGRPTAGWTLLSFSKINVRG